MVKVYGKKARQINAQDSSHRRAYTWVNAQGKERKERSGGKERKKFFSSPWEWIRTWDPHLRRQGSSLHSTITLHKDPWLQLLYKYHEGYILNSIAQYPMHMKERERSVIELNLKVQKTIKIAEYEQL